MKTLSEEIFTVPEILKAKHLPSLDGLRAVSVILIILTHTNLFITHKLGVEIFFVISGFIITTLLIKEKINNGQISLKKFYIRRFFRIIPVAFLYIFFIWLLNKNGHLNPEITWYYFFFAAFSLTNLFNNTWYFTHYWSLATEEQFYLIFPPILKKGIKPYLIFAVCFLVIIQIAKSLEWVFTKSAYPNQNDIRHYLHYVFHALKYFEGILIGSLLSVFVFKGFISFRFLGYKKVLVDCILVMAIGVFWRFNSLAGIFTHTLLLITIAIFIYNNLKPSKDIVFVMLNSGIFRYIGVLSYSLYVWQQPFTKFMPWAGAFPGADSIPLNLFILAVVSILSYHFVEKYFLAIKARFES